MGTVGVFNYKKAISSKKDGKKKNEKKKKKEDNIDWNSKIDNILLFKKIDNTLIIESDEEANHPLFNKLVKDLKYDYVLDKKYKKNVSKRKKKEKKLLKLFNKSIKPPKGQKEANRQLKHVGTDASKSAFSTLFKFFKSERQISKKYSSVAKYYANCKARDEAIESMEDEKLQAKKTTLALMEYPIVPKSCIDTKSLGRSYKYSGANRILDNKERFLARDYFNQLTEIENEVKDSLEQSYLNMKASGIDNKTINKTISAGLLKQVFASQGIDIDDDIELDDAIGLDTKDKCVTTNVDKTLKNIDNTYGAINSKTVMLNTSENNYNNLHVISCSAESG